jgi:hypothetical protein
MHIGAGFPDGGHGLDLATAHRGGASLDLVDAGRRQSAADGDLLRPGEGDAGRLLAVAQGGVVDENAAGGAHGDLTRRRA